MTAKREAIRRERAELVRDPAGNKRACSATMMLARASDHVACAIAELEEAGLVGPALMDARTARFALVDALEALGLRPEERRPLHLTILRWWRRLGL